MARSREEWKETIGKVLVGINRWGCLHVWYELRTSEVNLMGFNMPFWLLWCKFTLDLRVCRYNPDNVDILEQYVQFQADEDAYDFEANLTLLKL